MTVSVSLPAPVRMWGKCHVGLFEVSFVVDHGCQGVVSDSVSGLVKVTLDGFRFCL